MNNTKYIKSNTEMAKIVSNSLNSRRIIGMTLIGICVMAAVVSLTSARYLPTRSDDSKRELIKNVLRLVIINYFH